ncbi:MAG: 30S ribosomal protein S6 [Flavobacteriales bacterium]
MTNQYETVFILTPVLSEAQVKEAVTKFEDFLKENNAEIVHKENWGLKKLAYSIQNKKNGFYHLIEFKGDSDIVDKLEVAYRRDERIIRYLTVKMDKHHADFAVRRREKISSK